MRAQEASGDWPQQHISGVFNRNCMITYANYRYAAAILGRMGVGTCPCPMATQHSQSLHACVFSKGLKFQRSLCNQ
jgi:hypothetical protein